MKFLAIALFGIVIAAVTPASAQSESAAPSSIVGVWRLDELTNYDADGTPARPFGDPPAGTFIYTPDGRLSIQIMKTPPPEKYDGRSSEAQRAEAARGYLAYFGTYDIDYEAMTVIHKVEGALNPNYVDTERARAIKLTGDMLEIEIEAPDGRRAYRRLTRIERFDPPPADFSKLTGLNDPRHHILSSETVGRDYHLFVRLPEGYDPAGDPYPAVYLLDGDITFPMLGAYERYLSIYDETPDVILIGVAYGARTRAEGNRRTFDYTVKAPARDDTGGAEAFQKMFETEALPLIESAYHADPGKRIIFGQSLGGQFVLYTALTKPDLFWGHIASNPAIQDNPSYFSNVNFGENDRTASRLFVVSGEDDDERYLAPMRAWRAHWVGDRNKPWALKTAILDGHSHISIGPAAYREGMAWLFSEDAAGANAAPAISDKNGSDD